MQFTFQSGDIQIEQGFEWIHLLGAFTFQSGDIQIVFGSYVWCI